MQLARSLWIFKTYGRLIIYFTFHAVHCLSELLTIALSIALLDRKFESLSPFAAVSSYRCYLTQLCLDLRNLS